MGLFDFLKPKKDSEPKLKISSKGIPYMESENLGEMTFEKLMHLASSYAALQDYPKALKTVNLAIDLRVDDPECYRKRGAIKKALGDIDGACKDWKKCEDLGGDAYDLIERHCS